MVSIDNFRKMAMQFEEAAEAPHFEKTSFRVNKKIFATMDPVNKRAVVKLPEIEQSVFCSFDETIIYPSVGAWGRQGWTVIELTKIKKEMLQDALTVSYCTVAPKRLSTKYKDNEKGE